MVVIKDTVGYLPTIDAPATSMNTVLEILTNAKLIRDALQLKSVINAFDQIYFNLSIYFKTTEIFWKSPILYKNIMIRTGIFHTITMLLAIMDI